MDGIFEVIGRDDDPSDLRTNRHQPGETDAYLYGPNPYPHSCLNMKSPSTNLSPNKSLALGINYTNLNGKGWNYMGQNYMGKEELSDQKQFGNETGIYVE